jgi:hypothetical protein
MLRAGIIDPGYNQRRKFFVSTTLGNSPDTFRVKIRIRSIVVVTFVLAAFALQPTPEAVVPPPDGANSSKSGNGESVLWRTRARGP